MQTQRVEMRASPCCCCGGGGSRESRAPLHCQLAKALLGTELVQPRQTPASPRSRRSHYVLRVETAAGGERRAICRAPQVFSFTLLSFSALTAISRIDDIDPLCQTKGRLTGSKNTLILKILISTVSLSL